MPILLLLLVSVVSTYFPDPSASGVKIVSRQVTGGISDTKTEYLTANRMRNEWQTRMGDRIGPPMASIILRGSNQVFLLDLQAKEYVTYDSDSQAPLGSKSRPAAASGGILQIWIDNVDTGERLMMFGHMARHIVTREKRIASPGACSRSSESEIDGWYIDDSIMPEWHRPKHSANGGVVVASVIAFGADSPCIDKMDTLEVHRTGVDTGFPLKINTIVKSEVRHIDGSTSLVSSNWGSEVTDLQEGPLDPTLFEVPSDFRKVAALKSWSSPIPRRQLSTWEWIKVRIGQLFQ